MIQQPTPVAASRRASIPPSRHSRYLIIAPSPLPCQGEKFKSQFTTRLESGDLPLEDALNEFERGVQLARQGQVKLQQAEQRVQILLSDSEDAKTTPFTPDAE